MNRRPVTSELALVLLTLTTVLTCWRLFEGWSWLAPLGGAALVSHGLSATLRRAGWGSFTTLIASLLAAIEMVTLVRYADTTWFGLPTTTTWQVFQAELRVAWDAFPTAVAPVAATGGFLAMAMLGVWLVAHLSDDLAHRANTVFEAIVPQALLFVFATALGGDRMRLLAVALWLLAATITVAILRATQPTGAGWFGGMSSRALGASVRGALAVGALAVVAGVLLGPALPGAGSEPLLDTSQNRSSRTTVSPLVDIKARLVNQSDSVAFRVRADGAAYWRLTALDTFDGEIWRSSRSYGSASGQLAGDLPAGVGRTITQTFEIGDLQSVWLPAAFQPQRLSDPTLARYDEGSGSLLVRDQSLAEGTSYAVTSQVPVPDAPTVAGAAGVIPPAIAESYLQLPASFPPELREEARRRAGTGGGYAQALNLQAWFRSSFTYDLEGPTGHGTNAIQSFLESRRGYCEQFAGTFAAFARSIGLPARVAVGFTPGELDEEGRYVVRGRNAHAWPEVWFPGLGWLAFEPTPGRGVPGGEGYTGVAADQEGGAPEPPPTTTATSGSTIAPGVTATPPGNLPDGGQFPDDLFAGNLPDGSGGRSSSDGPPVLVPLLAVAGVALAAAVVWALAAPLLGAARRRRARARAADARDRVLVAWNEALGALRRHGDEVRPSETPTEVAARVGAHLGPAQASLDELAARATVAAFGADDLSESEGPTALALAERIEDQLAHQTGWWRRLWMRLDPRIVFG